jgi:hypothetical protein
MGHAHYVRGLGGFPRSPGPPRCDYVCILVSMGESKRVNVWGLPEEEVGRDRVRLGDVAEAVRELGYGRHTNAQVYARYQAVCQRNGREPGVVQVVGRVLAALGCPAVQVFEDGRYARGRVINLDALGRKWPRLFPTLQPSARLADGGVR